MKKFLPLLLSLTAALAAVLPAHAEVVKRSTLVERLDTCEAILQELQASSRTAIPADILRRARGLVIVNQLQAGLFLGIKDGYGVALVRRPNGKWSLPVFLRAGEASFGLQLGVKTFNTVMVLLDDDTARLLLKNRFNFGAEAKAIAGVRGGEAEGVNRKLLDGANVLVYSLQEGFYLGAAIKTGFLQPNQEANATFYNTTNKMPELLYSDWVTPPAETHFLMDYVTRLTTQ